MKHEKQTFCFKIGVGALYTHEQDEIQLHFIVISQEVLYTNLTKCATFLQ